MRLASTARSSPNRGGFARTRSASGGRSFSICIWRPQPVTNTTGLQATVGYVDPVSVRLQRVAHQLQQERIIVDHENAQATPRAVMIRARVGNNGAFLSWDSIRSRSLDFLRELGVGRCQGVCRAAGHDEDRETYKHPVELQVRALADEAQQREWDQCQSTARRVTTVPVVTRLIPTFQRARCSYRDDGLFVVSFSGSRASSPSPSSSSAISYTTEGRTALSRF